MVLQNLAGLSVLVHEYLPLVFVLYLCLYGNVVLFVGSWIVRFSYPHLSLVVLVVLAVKVKKGDYNGDDMNSMESGASYWHMVDLVWLVLFPMLYVLA